MWLVTYIYATESLTSTRDSFQDTIPLFSLIWRGYYLLEPKQRRKGKHGGEIATGPKQSGTWKNGGLVRCSASEGQAI